MSRALRQLQSISHQRYKYRVGPVAYKLDLPKNMRIHSVFHVQLLKQYKSNGRHQPPPLSIELENGFENTSIDSKWCSYAVKSNLCKR